jgi:iron complex transport system substrate-binding protein
VRIASLLPSATEIVCALGLRDALIGVSEECDFPAGVRDLPVVTAARVDTRGLASGSIDGAVRNAIAEGRSLYAIDEELVETLRPDIILTQDLCEVCAVSSREVAELCRIDAEVVSLDAHTIDEIERGIVTLAERLGVGPRGRSLVEEIEAKLAEIDARVRGRRRRPIFVAEWIDPPFAAGHWVPEMVERAGGRDVLGRPGAPSYTTTWAAVRAARPELVVLAACGFDGDRSAAEALASGLTLGDVPIVAVDANSYFSRPAPRLVDGVEQLAFLLHPEAVEDPGLPWREVAPVAA